MSLNIRRRLSVMWSSLGSLRSLPHFMNRVQSKCDELDRRSRIATRAYGTLLERSSPGGSTLADREFTVYSQWGEDGILSYLINTLRPAHHTFIEFGVEDYTEANTRWLIEFRNWRGLVLDGSEPNVQRIRKSDLYWMHSLTAVQAFVTRDNIDAIIMSNGFSGPIGLLSIDIDGMDYWVWERITCVDPIIVVVEYQSLFGPDRCVTLPYREDFVRMEAHYSGVYCGASLGALVALGERKGYAFVGSNSAGNNAFFVKTSHLVPPLRPLTAREGYVAAKFRESRNEDGSLAFLTFEEQSRILLSLPLVDVTSSSRPATP
jgi:hypothetical protein